MFKAFFVALLLSRIEAIISECPVSLSSMGQEFRPKMNITLLLHTSIRTHIRCATLCHKIITCRTFNYDASSKQCQLFEADASTGEIVSSPSLSSLVGTVHIIPSLYTLSHNRPCTTCLHSRYEICSTNTNTCQCPSHTYWNGQICALRLFLNDACTQADSCRSDLNLTCSINCYGEFERCVLMSSTASTYRRETLFLTNEYFALYRFEFK